MPVSLRITGYSPSPIPAYADRPTIHVEGEMGGVGWDGGIDIADEDIRRVHGTVSVLVDGSVRWSIVRPYVIAFTPMRLTRAIDVPRRRQRGGPMGFRVCPARRGRIGDGYARDVDRGTPRGRRSGRLVTCLPLHYACHNVMLCSLCPCSIQE